MRIAYLINQYPKVSHSFIRREIAALERQGVTVLRYALRGWDAPVVDAQDHAERLRTRYLLQGGGAGLLAAGLWVALTRPRRCWAALRQALSLGRRADRPWPIHLIYLAEACLLWRWLQASGAQHLHAHFGTNPTEVAMLCHTLGGPGYSFTVHGPEEFDKPEFIGLGPKVEQAAMVVAISSFGRSQVWRWVGFAHWHKVQVVHCALEPDFFVPLDRLTPPTSTTLVCVGRLCEQKGQLLLIEAAAQLAAEGLDFELVLAGDGEMRPQIEQAIARQQLAGRVRITGWVSSDQVRDLLLGSRALVLPSFAEGLPVVIMEALALGRPVISTWVAGIPELVRPEQEGWLVPAGDVQRLAQAMRDCLQATPATLATLGRSGRLRAWERHHADHQAQRLRQLFANLLAETKG